MSMYLYIPALLSAIPTFLRLSLTICPTYESQDGQGYCDNPYASISINLKRLFRGCYNVLRRSQAMKLTIDPETVGYQPTLLARFIIDVKREEAHAEDGLWYQVSAFPGLEPGLVRHLQTQM